MIKRINLAGNPNLGVYISVTDDMAIVPYNLPEVMEKHIIEALDVEIIRSSIAGSNLAGALSCGNSKGIVVSPFALDSEINILENAGLNVAKLPGKYTAVGNIIAANDIGAIASPFISKEAVEVIKNTLNIDVETSSMVGYDIIGSLITVTNKGFLIHKNAVEAEIEFAEKTFGVEGNIGTVGRGIALVGACSISNSKGVIVGEDSTGPEMARIEEALGFLKAF